LPIRLVVVSWPATISWKIVESSSRVSKRSSPSRALINALTRSLPGELRFTSTSASSMATTVSDARFGLGVLLRSRRRHE
jgi:hypothetical protein